MSKKALFIILSIVSILPVISLFHPGLPLTHDGSDHVARIANFYQSLTEGNLMPRWAANLNWGYGHPVLMFLYPLPSYVTSLFHAAGPSFVDSTKLVFGISYIASIIIFFLWASEQWNPAAGFVGALIYGFSPYRFVDLYVRGALGEHVAFVFAPLIFWGLLKYSRGQSKWSWLIISFGIAGLILSHNAVSLMVLPLVILYALYLSLFEAKRWSGFFFAVAGFISLGFILSAFFWLPAFFEGKYTLRDIVTQGEFSSRFVPLVKFFYSSWNYGGGNEFSKSLGILSWITILSSLVLFIKIKKKGERLFILGSLVIMTLSLFLMTSSSLPIWNRATFIQKFQFPWRFLANVILSVSMLAASVVSHIPKKFVLATSLGTTLLAILTTYNMWYPKSFIEKPEAYYSGIFDSTTDTGESSPIWSVRFMEHRPSAATEVISGSAQIVPIKRLSTRHDYSLNVAKKSRLVENTLYFPGWSVKVDGQEIPFEFQDPAYRGLITYWLPPGQHTVRIEFAETKLRRLADTLSMVGLAIVLGLTTITLWKAK